MDALERESRLWQARAAVGQDLDRLTAEAVALALDADPGQRARVAAANAASRLLLRLVDQVADSEARIEDVAALFSSRPVGLLDLLFVIGLGALLMVVLELEKAALRRLDWFDELRAAAPAAKAAAPAG